MRRALALIGFMLVLALAVALLWRVYLQHTQAEPYTDEPTLVRLDAGLADSVKIAPVPV